VNAVLLALAGAVVSVLAFPPFGPGWLIFFGIALFLWGLRISESSKHGLLVGAVYGMAFFSGLIWWLSELELIALILVPVQAVFVAAYGWWVTRFNDRLPAVWLTIAVGGWAVMEIIRYRFPVDGLEWGAAGYALSDQAWSRLGAPLIGGSGWTIVIVAFAGSIVLLISDRQWVPIAIGVTILFFIPTMGEAVGTAGGSDSLASGVAIVQGSTPCPFEHCSPNERLRTYEQHLELMKTIPAGEVELVVWSEGSTGSFNADPVNNPEIGEAIGAEARRIGAWVLVGSDRPISDEEWINANVLFNPEGEIVGEYDKQHPVPFGEYIPLRPVFDWIPALSAVPRDMIPGDGPEVFELDAYDLGSVISFEGSFSRYPRQHSNAGAQVMVVATNEGSYGHTPASDQLIGMTRMRAAELGMYVIHAAVTGKSVVIDDSGAFVSEISSLAGEEVIYATVVPRQGAKSPYSVVGDIAMYMAAVAGIAIWLRSRTLVASSGH
jgi:apolipoprotein N-acyltransferase